MKKKAGRLRQKPAFIYIDLLSMFNFLFKYKTDGRFCTPVSVTKSE